jgi:5-methylcytosine-specific restriction protein A
MPTINLPKRKYGFMTVNNKRFHRWYNHSRWRSLRDAKVRENPLCELCLLKDPQVIRPTMEVHHIIPIDVNNPDELLIYDWDNLQSLCFECHHSIHTKDRQIKNEQRKKAGHN